MKYLILLLLSNSVFAATINCYSGGALIYHGVSDNFAMNKEFIIVSYKGYDDVIFRKNKTSPNCIATHVKN